MVMIRALRKAICSRARRSRGGNEMHEHSTKKSFIAETTFDKATDRWLLFRNDFENTTAAAKWKE